MMLTLKPGNRFILHILRHVMRHRLDLLIPTASISNPILRGILFLVQRTLPAPKIERGERLANALLELGPVYIKLGQLLSTRRDLLPGDVADQLALLQDQVPPIPNFDVTEFVAAQLGEDPNTIFSHIETEPMASASIAQIHAACLVDSQQAVVLKLVRPGIQTRISQDMAALKDLAQRITIAIPDARRLQLERVCADHEQVLLQELDMYSEARNQVQLRRNFAESNLLYVPKVYRQFTRQKLLVMERVYGPPISHIDELNQAGVDLKVLAHKGVETFFTQVFEHNFFHADMHPGNILVDTSKPEDPKYIALDCAIIGTLTTDDQNYLAQNLLAFFHRDYKQVVQLHLESGWVPANTNPQEFEAVIKEVCEPIFAKPLGEISFAEFVLTLFQTAGRFNMEIQPQLVLLQKTLLYIEGVGRELYPQLDLWETAEPFMQAWATRHLGPAAVVNNWLNAGPQVWQQLANLPNLIATNQAQLDGLKSQMSAQSQAVDRIEASLSKQRASKRYKQVAGAGFVGVSLWMLWQPLAAGLSQGDMTMVAGLVSAFLGSALLIKA